MNDHMSGNGEASTAGWDAIDAALKPLYLDQEPKHFGAVIPYMLGGSDPLQGISAWKRFDPVPHWHYITYGFSELYEKESEDRETSGYGFELTFRVACDPSDEDPPVWASNLLQNLGRYVFKSGNVFAHGHWMNANGPIALETDTQLVSIGIISDPELPAIDTPNGRLAFLQLVGLTLDEERAVKRWNAEKLMEALKPHVPLWVTDLHRSSLIDLPDVKAALDAGMARDGSSTGLLLTEVLSLSSRKRLFRPSMMTIGLGAAQVDELVSLLSLRLPHQQEMRMAGPDAQLLFVPADADAISESGAALCIELAPQTLSALAATLRPVAGSYRVPGLDIDWNVQQSLIRDRDGNVVRTVG